MSVQNWTVPRKSDPGLTIAEMKEFVQHHFQSFVNEKDLLQANRSFSEDFLDHDEPTGVEVGIEAAKAMMGQAHQR